MTARQGHNKSGPLTIIRRHGDARLPVREPKLWLCSSERLVYTGTNVDLHTFRCETCGHVEEVIG